MRPSRALRAWSFGCAIIGVCVACADSSPVAPRETTKPERLSATRAGMAGRARFLVELPVRRERISQREFKALVG